MQRKVSDIIATGERTFSFEFFPPKTDEGELALWQALRELEPLSPDFVSVTYGAGGTTRDRTVAITRRVVRETTMNAVGHLTCVGASAGELIEIVQEYRAAGVRNILALRGDPVGGPGAAWTQHPGGLNYASELVELVRAHGDFSLGVAAFPEKHPSSPSVDADARVLLRKERAGATFAITQFFFELEPYKRLVERSRRIGCTIPIIPGLMPVTNVAQIERFAALSGVTVPPRLADRFHGIAQDTPAVRRLGVEVASTLAAQLLDAGAPGLHFYTLNRSTATREVFQALGMPTS